MYILLVPKQPLRILDVTKTAVYKSQQSNAFLDVDRWMGAHERLQIQADSTFWLTVPNLVAVYRHDMKLLYHHEYKD
jgi:hypothetical protein